MTKNNPQTMNLNDFQTQVHNKGSFILSVLNGEKPMVPAEHLVPGEKQCKFCRAKASCPAFAKNALTVISEDFNDLTKDNSSSVDKILQNIPKISIEDLARIEKAAPLIEMILSAVRGRIEAEMFSGNPVPGFKIVQGKKGNREFEEEENQIKDCLAYHDVKPEDMYESKLLTPSKFEKKLKKNPDAWGLISNYITQSEGKPSVAPATDPRPAIAIPSSVEDFDDLTKIPLT